MKEKNNKQNKVSTPKQKPSTPRNKKTNSPGVSKKEEKAFLERNQIEDNIVNETPIVYETPQCTFPTAGILEKKAPKLSLWERFVDFIINL
jgi:hypothetical protein